MAQVLAIASCRVSSDEQLLNNSLNRQKQAVLDAAKRLDASIPNDAWWSGSQSSKRGTNLGRKDLKEMLSYCSKNKRVKYLIVDEPDRFMRSIDEAMYFEVTFREQGVKIWYASDQDLNTDNMSAKLMKFMKYFVAEGSNEERQNKSISGQTTALKEGRYTFHPKPAYKKSMNRGIHVIDEIKGPILQKCLKDIAHGLVSPTEALKQINTTDFISGRTKPYKMDRFRKIITDPYYAGIVEIDRQVKFRNENGLHEPLITKNEHLLLVQVMHNKKKNQAGPRKNENPEYGMNNIAICKKCLDKSEGRFVGFDHTNGVSSKVYKRYRCRSCGLYMHKEDLHNQVQTIFNRNPIATDAIVPLKDALEEVWKRRKESGQQESTRLKSKIILLEKSIKERALAAIDPTNSSIKSEILESITQLRQELESLNAELVKKETSEEIEYSDFLEFAFSFIAKMGSNFFEISKTNRERCKDLAFPSGFYVDENKKVYTPEISELFRLGTIKKDSPESEKSFLVRVKRL